MSVFTIPPSVETKPTTIRKLLVDLATRMPCCCTVCGSRGTASCTLFCTCTCATSGLEPWAKVSWMVALPSFDVLEEK